MTTGTYYNERDPVAAAWLRELILHGYLADGEVDDRSICDVQPDDLTGFTQHHFFAGIGGWSHALRLAGWPDDSPVWTGSCPCQPFSSAGKGAGVDDPRHLWPTWFRLIRQCRPPVVFGEQVEAAVAHGWLDLVCDDLEGEGYAVGACGLPACSVGAPHIRQRLWFVAESRHRNGRCGDTRTCRTAAVTRKGYDTPLVHDCNAGELVYSEQSRLEEYAGDGANGLRQGREVPQPDRPISETGVSNFWSPCDWLPCRDGKARPVEPGTFPLAHGVSGRVGLLRGYGNAIVPHVAEAFIRAYLDTRRGIAA